MGAFEWHCKSAGDGPDSCNSGHRSQIDLNLGYGMGLLMGSHKENYLYRVLHIGTENLCLHKSKQWGVNFGHIPYWSISSPRGYKSRYSIPCGSPVRFQRAYSRANQIKTEPVATVLAKPSKKKKMQPTPYVLQTAVLFKSLNIAFYHYNSDELEN
ncbi:hypothetical protein B0H19DRAFT_1058664 [Mycena capillaripes]|nr:hypothetical protein B0H19DRAFT_1058664 [Mycena capillaripes]